MTQPSTNVTGLRVLGIAADSSIAAANIGTDSNGGTQYRLRQYGIHLHKLDYIVRTFRHQQGLHPDHFTLSENVAIYPTHSRGLDFVLAAYRIASDLLSRQHYDVIVAQDASVLAFIALLLRARFGVPVSLTIYGDHISNPLYRQEGLRQRLTDALANWILPRVDTVRVDSQLVKNRLMQIGISGERLWAYPVFIRDLDKWNQGDRTHIRQRFNLANNPLVVCIARLEAQKNIPNLIAAFKLVSSQMPDARCIIVGGGSKAKELEESVNQLGLQQVILFAGAAKYDELIDYYAACDVLTLSSNYEGIPRVFIEGSAAERAIVATNVGGISEVVHDGETGFLVKPNDSTALGEALLRVLSNPTLAHQMGKRARERVLGTYNEEFLVPHYIHVWEETAKMQAAHR